MTPIPPVPNPLPYTLLSLDRFAQILGINPANFNSATGGSIFSGSQCSDLWYQHDWQNYDRVSRECLANAILEAETDLMKVVQYPLAPIWIAEEVHPYPTHHRTDVYGGVLNNRYQHKGLHTNLYKVLSGGIRAVTLVESGIVPTYLDLDHDGLFETARISCATTETDVREIKVYFHDMAGEQEWEIRPCKTKKIVAGTFTADFWLWQLIEPSLREEFSSGDDVTPIDISGGSAFIPGDPFGNPVTQDVPAVLPNSVVDEVDVYREYNDNTANSVELYWEDSDDIGYDTQTGTLIVRDPELGWVVPSPATYNTDWITQPFTCGREPDLVKLWYQAGNVDTRYYQSKSFDPLSDYWAKIIAMVATARLDRDICGCGCGNTETMFAYWREDMTLSDAGKSHYVNFSGDTLDNPLGTHRGEVMAWNKIRTETKLDGVAL